MVDALVGEQGIWWVSVEGEREPPVLDAVRPGPVIFASPFLWRPRDAHDHPARCYRHARSDARNNEADESTIDIVRVHARNVKRWRDGDMRLRWAAAGMLCAEQQYRRVKGYKQLDKLTNALARHITPAITTNQAA